MIVSQHDLELILNPRIRQRTFMLPVRRGKWGELKRCPARKGGVYTLRAGVPYERYRREAGKLGSQRAGVLWLIDRCEQPTAGVLVTVSSVELAETHWLVGFVKGDQSDRLDKPRLLAARPGGAGGDYTNVPGLALSGAAEEIQAPLQSKYAERSWQRRTDGLSEQRERIQAAVATARLEAVKQNIGSAAVRKRLKSLEHHLRAWEQEARRSA